MLHRDNYITDLSPITSGKICLSQQKKEKKKTKKALQFLLIGAVLASFWKLKRPSMDIDVVPRPAQK